MKKSEVEKHFDKIAKDYDKFTKKRDLHYSTLKLLLKSLIPKDKKVFEFGCGTGDILASLNTKSGYGMDISSKMIKIAQEKYRTKRNLFFSKKWPNENFDFVFMSDVIEHLENPQEVFNKIVKRMNKRSIFICTMMNPIWEPAEAVYSWLGLKMPEGKHKRIKFEKIAQMLNKSGLMVLKHDYRLLMPIKIPLITHFMNNYLERYLKRFAFIEYFTATKS